MIIFVLSIYSVGHFGAKYGEHWYSYWAEVWGQLIFRFPLVNPLLMLKHFSNQTELSQHGNAYVLGRVDKRRW
jgi:hypothetical protein